MGLYGRLKNDKPWQLISLQKFDHRNEAMWKERQLKKSKGLRDRWIVDHAYGSESEVSKQTGK